MTQKKNSKLVTRGENANAFSLRNNSSPVLTDKLLKTKALVQF